jgi:L,D-transpeptidase ErfK/SrfK
MPNPSTTCALVLASSLLLFASHAGSETFPLPPRGTDLVGEVRAIVTKRGDTLLDIARRFGLGYGEITSANPGIDPWVPDEGTRVVLPTQFVLPPGPRRGIVLNLPQLRLFYFPPPPRGKPAQVVTLPVGIGTDYATTPLGETRVIRKAVDPVWRPSRDIREEHVADGHWLAAQVPPGPDNPLGKYALYLGLKGGYIIHGTNKPWGVGMRVSHGCIRLYPESIASLYPQVPVGTTVRVISEQLLLGMQGGVPYLQVFRGPEKRAASVENLTPYVEAILRRMPRGEAVDWEKVMDLLRAARTFPVPIAPGTPDMEQVMEQASDVSQDAAPDRASGGSR